MKRIALILFAVALWTACGAAGRDPIGCAEGETATCACSDGTTGTQTCNSAGMFDTCACATSLPTNEDAAAPGDPKCNDDGVCNNAETCRSCPRDCGECQQCALAPSCTNASGVPSKPTLRADLSDPKVDGGTPPRPDGGASTCRDPELRLRIERVLVHKGGGQIYCVVSATDGATSEAALTQKTIDLGDDKAHYFDPSTSIYWGQAKLRPTTNNLAITLDCFKVNDSAAWSAALKALGDTAAQIGGTQTPFGWAFGLGGVAANAAAAAIAAGAAKDDHRFNAQQVIDKSELLDLTNGRYWSLRRSGGCGLFCSWDWEVFIQSWGCAEGADAPPR